MARPILSLLLNVVRLVAYCLVLAQLHWMNHFHETLEFETFINFGEDGTYIL